MPLTQVQSGLLESGAALNNIGAGNITPSFLSTQSQYTGFKNRLINGACVIDQRNNGASVTPNAGATYTVDRWLTAFSQNSKFSIQRNAGSVTPPTGFINYLGATVTSAYSVGSADFFTIQQPIEGFNVADLGWGTASAQPVTLSFWVRSSLTGTFGGAFNNSGATRNYPFSYTISAANTWEYKTVTVPGDTTGTWLTNNGVGISLNMSLGMGSTYSGTAGAWTGSTVYSATGATSVVGTNGATFYITGVQLEKGSTATSFDYRPYGTELALCQRYYETGFSKFYAGNASDLAFATTFKVQKRTAPTQTYSNPPGGMTIRLPTANEAITVDGFSIYRSGPEASFSWASSAEL